MDNFALDILSDESFQTQLSNHDAMAGLDEYADDLHEVEALLERETGLNFRGAGERRMLQATWPQAMVIDMALALDPLPDILNRYSMTEAQWDILQDNTAFRLDLARCRKEISESGLSFKRKAATQAEMYLLDMDDIMQDGDTSASLKHEIFKTMVRCGDLEPARKREEAEGVAAQGTFNIQINF